MSAFRIPGGAVLESVDRRFFGSIRAFGRLIHSSTHNDGYDYIFSFFKT